MQLWKAVNMPTGINEILSQRSYKNYMANRCTQPVYSTRYTINKCTATNVHISRMYVKNIHVQQLYSNVQIKQTYLNKCTCQ